MKVLIGCEESQAVCKEFRALGHEAYSCDLLPCSGGNPEWHLQMDVFKAICGGVLITEVLTKVEINNWDMGIFFPDCTYLTCSAEWAYKDGPYHQKVKPGTLVGALRRHARENALGFVRDLMNCSIPKIGIENPVGVIGARIFWYRGGENGGERWEVFPKDIVRGGRKPDQIIQPWQFGDDASKSTCLWLKGLPLLTLEESLFYPPRIVDGKKRWGNQTDLGQNKLSPSDDRAKMRSKTYPGIARAMAKNWSKSLTL